MEEGSGIIHIAPGHGAEDYLIGKRYGLDVFSPVDEQGRFTAEVSPWKGQVVSQANDGIVEELRTRGMLIHREEASHPYPHCWRCHTPIIFRATGQWFLSVEENDLRERLLEAAAKEIQWIPPEGRERMSGMLKTRPDWCLSRQRLWGIPIPAVICAGCDEPLLDPGVIERFAAVVESEPEGADRWFTENPSRWLPSRFRCPGCKGCEFSAGTDILDVWFDSGVSHQAVLKSRQGLAFPADLYLEGSDQHRGWFQVSLITCLALGGLAPYRGVLTHGFVVDGEGRKMSKSLGNVIAPQELVSSMGADILRLWVASSDYREDVRLSPKILSQVAEVYRKIRNTLRFCLANLSDFSPSSLSFVKEKIDRWALSRLGGLVEEVTQAYELFAFHRVVKAIHEFCTVELSNFYLDAIKDRLYAAHPKDPERLSAQGALWEIAQTLIRLIAPLLPMTAEEAWANLAQDKGVTPPESVHLQPWPKADAFPRDLSLEKEWDEILKIRDQAMKALEEARAKGLIGDALEAELEVTLQKQELYRFLESKLSQLTEACIVSGLTLSLGPTGQAVKEEAVATGLEIQVRKASGAKCQRCWMWLPTVGVSSQHPDLCRRCVEVVTRLLAQRPAL